MPSRQAPVPSCQVIRAPPPWPLTLRTDQPIPAVCRWLSSGHHMLTKVNHHSSRQTLSFLSPFPCLTSFSISYFKFLKAQATLYFYLSQWAPVQCPGGSFLSFSLLTPVGSYSISVPLLVTVLLALSSTCLLLSPVIHYCNLSSPCLFFFELSVQCALCLRLSRALCCPTSPQHLSPDLA